MTAATNGSVPATAEQFEAIVATCIALFRFHDWTLGSSDARLLAGHDSQAIWTPALTRAAGMLDDRGRLLWGRLGRKVDPTGRRSDGVPIIDVNQVRLRVAQALRSAGESNDPRPMG